MKTPVQIVAVFAVGVALASASQAQKMQRGPFPHQPPIPYARVGELFKFKCVSCHNAKSHPKNVDLSSLDAVLKSGDHGPIVVPGHPEKSKLIAWVNGSKQPRMPLKQPPLGNAQMDILKRWIGGGAKN